MRQHPLPQHPVKPDKNAKKIGFVNFVDDISRFYIKSKEEQRHDNGRYTVNEFFRDFNLVAQSKKSGRYPRPVEQCVQMAYVQNNNNKQYRSIIVVDIDDADLEKGVNSKTLQNIYYLCGHGLTPNLMILNPLNKKSIHLQFYIQRKKVDAVKLHKNLHEQERFDALVQRLNILFHGDFQNKSLSIKNPFSDLYLNCVSVLRDSYWQLNELSDMSQFVYNHKFTKGRVCFTAVYDAHNKKHFAKVAREYFSHWESEFKNPFFRPEILNKTQTYNYDDAVFLFDQSRLSYALSPLLNHATDNHTALYQFVKHYSSRNVGLFHFLCKKASSFIYNGNASKIYHELCAHGRSFTLEEFIRISSDTAENLNIPQKELRSIMKSVCRYAQLQYVPYILKRTLVVTDGSYYSNGYGNTFLSEEEQNYQNSPFTIKNNKAYFEPMTLRVKKHYDVMRDKEKKANSQLCQRFLSVLSKKGNCPAILFDDDGFPTWLSKKGFNIFYREYWLNGLGGENNKNGRKYAKLLAKYLYENMASAEQKEKAVIKLNERKEILGKKHLERKFLMLGERLSRYYNYQYLPDWAVDIERNGLANSSLLAFVKNLWENVYCEDNDLENYRWRTLSHQERKEEMKKGLPSQVAQILRNDMNKNPERYNCLFKNPENFDKGKPSKYRLDYQIFQDNLKFAHQLSDGHPLNIKLLPIDPMACEKYQNVYQYLKVEQAIQYFPDLKHLKHSQKTYDNLFIANNETEERILKKIFYQDQNKKVDRFAILRYRQSEIRNKLYRDDFNILKGDFDLVKRFLSLKLRSKSDLYKHRLHKVYSKLLELFECLSLPHISHFSTNY